MNARQRALAAEEKLTGAIAEARGLAARNAELARSLDGSRALAARLATEHLGACGHAQLAARERARATALEERIRTLTTALAGAAEQALALGHRYAKAEADIRVLHQLLEQGPAPTAAGERL